MSQAYLDILRSELETKSRKFEQEIQELRQMVVEGRISTDRAHERIDGLERTLAEMKAEIKQLSADMQGVKEVVQTFSPKLDLFMANLWKAFFMLLVILAGVLGIKLM